MKQLYSLFLIAIIILCQGCSSLSFYRLEPEPVALCEAQWTGIAVSENNRLFVNFPRWSDETPVSVAELVDGQLVPYPDEDQNDWNSSQDPLRNWVCVQAMYIDKNQQLWILDPGNPQFKGVIPNAPKLVQIDLKTDKVVKICKFNGGIIKPDSYLNDLRIDNKRDFAYITDSGNGALISLNLKTSEARRWLDNHPSTHSEPDTVLTIEDEPWKIGEKIPEVHADGIAFDPLGDLVYYQALTGRTMYELTAKKLRQQTLPDSQIIPHIRTVGQTGASDGLIFYDGKIYITALEKNAILRTTPNGIVETVVQSPLISWADSFAMGPDNYLYFTTARIHEGSQPEFDYGIYRIKLY